MIATTGPRYALLLEKMVEIALSPQLILQGLDGQLEVLEKETKAEINITGTGTLM